MFIDILPINIFSLESENVTEYIKLFIPILCVILGAIIGFGIQKLNDYLSFRKLRKYFIYSLFSLYKSFRLQIEQLTKYINTLDKRDNDKPIFLLVTGFSLNSISVVSKDNIFKILTKSRIKTDVKSRTERKMNRFKDHKNLLIGFELIESLVTDYKIESRFVYDTINKKMEEYKEKINLIRNEILNLKKIYNTSGYITYKEFIKELDSLDKEIQKKYEENKLDKKNFFDYFDNAIKPLQQISSKHDQILLLQYCLEAEIIITELLGTKESFSNLYKRYKSYLEDFEGQIKNILIKYNKYLHKKVRETI